MHNVGIPGVSGRTELVTVRGKKNGIKITGKSMTVFSQVVKTSRRRTSDIEKRCTKYWLCFKGNQLKVLMKGMI